MRLQKKNNNNKQHVLTPNCGEINLDTFNFSSGSIMLQSLWTNDAGSSTAITVAVHFPL